MGPGADGDSAISNKPLQRARDEVRGGCGRRDGDPSRAAPQNAHTVCGVDGAGVVRPLSRQRYEHVPRERPAETGETGWYHGPTAGARPYTGTGLFVWRSWATGGSSWSLSKHPPYAHLSSHRPATWRRTAAHSPAKR